MKEYDERMEDLLLGKPYEALSPTERSYADARLGGEPAYTTERRWRVRVHDALLAETAPADENGLQQLMTRLRPRGWGPWQVAAAVFLAALLAWWARGLLPEPPLQTMERIAAADTVWKEVRVPDTVYLPAPDTGGHWSGEDHPLQRSKSVHQPQENRRNEGKPELRNDSSGLPSKLAAAIAELPDPGSVGRQGGVQGHARQVMELEGAEAKTDKFHLQEP